MPSTTKIFVGCDHAGLSLKRVLLEQLTKEFPNLSFNDVGCESDKSVDYPEFAKAVAKQVSRGEGRGILVCGSGIGMSIAANKVSGVRAANVWDATSARLSRQHNDSNILCMGARLTGAEVALEAARVWLATAYLGGRHDRRLELIHKMETEK